MQELIGEELSEAIKCLNKKGIAYTVSDNNFSVNGDTKLVTNVIAKEDTMELIVGNFIFDVRNKENVGK